MPNNSAIEVEVNYHYQTEPEKVYQAWLSEELAQQWFGPGLGETEPVQIDANVGGKFRIVQVRDGQPVGHGGEYLALDRPNFLSFTWAMDGMEEISVVKVYITPTSGGSSVKLVHEIDEQWREYIDRTREAWLGMMREMEELIK
ncbi:SRPBCC family protein [Pontibacter anaerobius]|uniref:SRPBCC domain-containing protein n=1 Tax=Pontibacter anaerobius TaxID=2993940 RepID=A0ABT3RG21_9BACT|nr:SRPBCC domain-containing protein [Pontibacter anaerobius]MCX2740200.1 SRPBCC domain-containing protein [Pontibacter anaerobius]